VCEVKGRAVVFSRASDEWRTPQALFEALDAEFGFDLDAAATAENCWVENYIGPDRTRVDRRDTLACPWAETTWLNPPYSQCRAFIEKAAMEARRGCTVVALVPARTDTRWFHAHIYDRDANRFRPGVEVRFLKGRLKFGDSANSAPFPSMLVIFRPEAV
jgi:site-specific DNA-methyltransferase (adenine-specific)